jgi:hypothetical protein
MPFTGGVYYDIPFKISSSYREHGKTGERKSGWTCTPLA